MENSNDGPQHKMRKIENVSSLLSTTAVMLF